MRIAERHGAFGPRASVDALIEHASGFVAALGSVSPGGRVADLGAGGGVPGLVIATDRPDLELVLIDRRQSRTDLLRRLVRRLELDERVRVIATDARRIAAVAEWVPVDAAVARGFAAPLRTVETAVPLVRPAGGLIVISEPPDGHQWSPADVARLDSLGVRRQPFRPPAGAGRVAVLVRST